MSRTPLNRAALAAALLAAAAAAPFRAAETPAAGAGASVPAGDPVFTAPLVVDNAFFPVTPGSLKVHAGREGRDGVTVVEAHLADVRTFSWSGMEIPCRTVRETIFVDGAVTDTSTAWFAQADDGTVWTFGEVNDPAGEEDDGTDEDDRSWVVGALAPGDPPDAVSVPGPTVFMPATPEVGDVWTPDAGDPATDEVDTLLRTAGRLRTPAGLFEDCIVVEERSGASPGRQLKWYAAGTGVVQSRAPGERLRLMATTLGAPARPPRRPWLR